jgi:hypothetical protein
LRGKLLGDRIRLECRFEHRPAVGAGSRNTTKALVKAVGLSRGGRFPHLDAATDPPSRENAADDFVLSELSVLVTGKGA